MAKTEPFVPTEFENLGSLITYKDPDGRDCCLGSLIDFKDKGVFDAEYGKVEISPEHVAAHNAELDKALVKGLDESCQVGQCGMFYMSGVAGDPAQPLAVKTFTGTVVATGPAIKRCYPTGSRPGLRVVFERNGKTFEGRWKPIDGALVNFKRIA